MKFRTIFEMAMNREKMLELRSKAKRDVSIQDFYLLVDYKGASLFNNLGMVWIKDSKLSEIDKCIKELKNIMDIWKRKANEVDVNKLKSLSSAKYEKLVEKYRKERLSYMSVTYKEISPYEHFIAMFKEANKEIVYYENILKLLDKIKKKYRQALEYKDKYDE